MFEESREVSSRSPVDEINATVFHDNVLWHKVQVAHVKRIAIEIDRGDRFGRVHIEPNLEVRRLRELDFFVFGPENT